MPRTLILACLSLALAGPALAAQNPGVGLYTQQDSRAVAVQNWSGHDIAEAQVQTTPDGRVWQLGNIQVDEGSEAIVPGGDCIANVFVRFHDGRTLALSNLQACNNTEVVVRNNSITIPQQAVPGAEQHGTPG